MPVTAGVNCCAWVALTTAASLGDKVTVTLGAATVRFIGAVGARLPEVPVMVRVAVPIAAEVAAVRVNTLVVEVLDGVNNAETPDGSPDADNVALPVKPFCGTTVMVLVTVPPWPTFGLEGAAESVKLGGGGGVVPPPQPARHAIAFAAMQRPARRATTRLIVALS